MAAKNLNIVQLLKRCIKGNQMAQMQVYNSYYKAMYNTSLRIVKHTFEAEDIAQESFLIAFNKLDTLNDLSVFGAWLKQIVINNSIKRYKDKQKMPETALENYLYKLEDDNTEPVDDRSKIKLILKSIDALKPNYRIALTLNLIEGYDHEEISEILNISYASSRTTLSRAKEKLREELKQHNITY